jgi:enoyl-CoA hydratase/carnithine racemase
MSDDLLVERSGPVLTVTANRPERHNAMTVEMYDQLFSACRAADNDPHVRVLVLRGAGDKAFVSGTDISTFHDVQDGAAGVAYERRIAQVVDRLEEVTVPTIAAVRGYCMGGGLALAAVCDLRVATRSARFGVPIARTLGNCLSVNSVSVLVGQLGPARTLDLLLRARSLTGEEAAAAGFVAELCDDDALDAALAEVVDTLLAHAPLTIAASKAAVTRLRRAGLPADAIGEDVVARAFGSDDFRRAVAGFGSGEPTVWRGV